jgi:hypothetical protein
MDVPSQHDREALLELLLAMGGPLLWTGPIPYDALGARHSANHAAATTPDGQVPTPSPEPLPPSRHAA